MLYNLDLDDLETQISQWCDDTITHHITSHDLFKAIESMRGGDQKPGLNLLSEKQKQSYKKGLKSKLEKTIRNQEAQRSFSKEEVKSFFLRYLIDAAAKNYNSEFDLLILLKVCYKISSFNLI